MPRYVGKKIPLGHIELELWLPSRHKWIEIDGVRYFVKECKCRCCGSKTNCILVPVYDKHGYLVQLWLCQSCFLVWSKLLKREGKTFHHVTYPKDYLRLKEMCSKLKHVYPETGL